LLAEPLVGALALDHLTAEPMVVAGVELQRLSQGRDLAAQDLEVVERVGLGCGRLLGFVAASPVVELEQLGERLAELLEPGAALEPAEELERARDLLEQRGVGLLEQLGQPAVLGDRIGLALGLLVDAQLERAAASLLIERAGLVE